MKIDTLRKVLTLLVQPGDTKFVFMMEGLGYHVTNSMPLMCGCLIRFEKCGGI